MKTLDLPPFDYQPKPYAGPPAEEVLRLRKQFLNPGIFLYYKKPLMIVEGRMQDVFDEAGRRYLDALACGAPFHFLIKTRLLPGRRA